MKKIVSILMTIVLTLSLCTAFAEEPVTVRILTRSSNPDNVREKYFMDMVAKFNEEHTDIILEDVSISDETAHDTLFKTSVAAGDPIEVFDFLGYAANLDYVSNGVIVDINKAIADDPNWTAQYIQGLFAPVNYSAYGVEGVYGIPTAPYGVCCFYNKAIFNKLGLELPTTWEAIEACAPILTENGYIPMTFGAKDNYRAGHFFTALSMKYNGDKLKDGLISGEVKWNDEKVVELAAMMQKWYETDVFGTHNLSYDANGELARLESGEAAIIFSGSWNIATINGFANINDLVCKGFPSFESKPEFKDEWMGGPDNFLSITSKPEDDDYEATITVLKYFTSYDYLKGLYELQKGAGTYPVNFTEIIEADNLTNGFNADYSVATNMIGEIEQFSTMTSLMDVVRNGLTTIFAGNTAEVVCNDIQAEVEAYN
ncbi:MAG: ABC transporter substrate-binding protein [Clostridia bacterium]